MSRASLIGFVCGLWLGWIAWILFDVQFLKLMSPRPRKPLSLELSMPRGLTRPPLPLPRPIAAPKARDIRDLDFSVNLGASKLLPCEPLALVIRFSNMSNTSFQATPESGAGTIKVTVSKFGEEAEIECASFPIGFAARGGEPGGHELPCHLPAGAAYGMRLTLSMFDEPGQYTVWIKAALAGDTWGSVSTRHLNVEVAASERPEDAAALADYRKVRQGVNPFDDLSIAPSTPLYSLRLLTHFMKRHPSSVYAGYAGLTLASGREVPHSERQELLRQVWESRLNPYPLRAQAAIPLMKLYQESANLAAEARVRCWIETDMPEAFSWGEGRYTLRQSTFPAPRQ